MTRTLHDHERVLLHAIQEATREASRYSHDDTYADAVAFWCSVFGRAGLRVAIGPRLAVLRRLGFVESRYEAWDLHRWKLTEQGRRAIGASDGR